MIQNNFVLPACSIRFPNDTYKDRGGIHLSRACSMTTTISEIIKRLHRSGTIIPLPTYHFRVDKRLEAFQACRSMWIYSNTK